MTNDNLKIKITELLPAATFEEAADPATGILTVIVMGADWKTFSRLLFFDETLQFDFLNFCTAVDNKTHLTMVYYFDSYIHNHNLAVKIKLDAVKPEVETVSDIWPTANFHEREVYELLGVNFINHPDLRLLILPEGWEGKNPLRKDFEDPVNMIRL